MLNIYIPDWTDDFDKPSTIPPLYPFLNKGKTHPELVQLYGRWINEVKFVSSLKESDVVVLLYEVGYYFKRNELDLLKKMNAAAASANKITICWTKGDEGITPSLQHFHLYRMGGYRSKNKGNQFLVPVFIEDPLPKYFNNQLPLHNKTNMPVVGFCGQGKAGVAKNAIDIYRNIKKRFLKLLNKYHLDLESLLSSTFRRSQILDHLEKSSLVTTNFIRHKKYRAGLTTKESREESSRIYFKNMAAAQYVVCYRGAGNFSVRLYETLASGKIPVVICSDNNLPFEEEIDWNKFIVVPARKWKDTAKIIFDFHSALSAEEFVALQNHARHIYEEYISYKGFMTHWVKRYHHLSAGHEKQYAVHN